MLRERGFSYAHAHALWGVQPAEAELPPRPCEPAYYPHAGEEKAGTLCLKSK